MSLWDLLEILCRLDMIISTTSSTNTTKFSDWTEFTQNTMNRVQQRSSSGVPGGSRRWGAWWQCSSSRWSAPGARRLEQRRRPAAEQIGGNRPVLAVAGAGTRGAVADVLEGLIRRRRKNLVRRQREALVWAAGLQHRCVCRWGKRKSLQLRYHYRLIFLAGALTIFAGWFLKGTATVNLSSVAPLLSCPNVKHKRPEGTYQINEF
jgi:hypothetical protein